MSKVPLRIIARLDIKNENVIKGIHLEGLRIVGDHNNLALNYYETGIDEIIYMDVVASLYGRNNIQVHYLGYYKKWTPQEVYYYALENADFQVNIERTEGTYSKYISIEEDNFFEIANSYRSPHLWKKDGSKFILRNKVK